jgi:hypothetical protein
MTPALERAVAPLDDARGAVLRALLGVAPLKYLLARRDRRIALWATVHALVALALTAAYPMLLFVLGPVLLGVVHVAADVRYLVLRRQLPSWWKSAVWIGCAALIGLRIAEELGFRGSSMMRLELLCAIGWILIALAAGSVARGNATRAALALPLVAMAALACALWPYAVRIAFVHLHNLFAIVLWIALFRLRPRAALVPLLVIAAASAWLLLWPYTPLALSEATGGIYAFRLHLYAASDWLAPGVSPELSTGLTLSYVFLQSVHYSAWLFLIPQEDTRAEGTLTFRMSVRSLLSDFGVAGIVAIALAAAAVIAGACFGVHRARNLYLSLAMFHGYMEVALLAYFWARGARPASMNVATSSAAGLPAAS